MSFFYKNVSDEGKVCVIKRILLVPGTFMVSLPESLLKDVLN